MPSIQEQALESIKRTIVHVIPPDTTISAREVVMLSALLDAYRFANKVKAVTIGMEEDELDAHLSILSHLLYPYGEA